MAPAPDIVAATPLPLPNARPLADGFRLAARHLPLFWLCLLPYAIALVALPWGITMSTGDTREMLETLGGIAILFLVGAPCWLVLELMVAGRARGQPVSMQTMASRLREQIVALCVGIFGLALTTSYGAVALLFLLVLVGMWVESQLGARQLGGPWIGYLVVAIVIGIPAYLALRWTFFTEQIVLAEDDQGDGFRASWRLTSGRKLYVLRTFGIAVLPTLLLTYGTLLWPRRSGLPALLVPDIANLLSLAYTPFFVAVRVFLWDELRTESSAAQVEIDIPPSSLRRS
jgi:hypothetical protein